MQHQVFKGIGLDVLNHGIYLLTGSLILILCSSSNCFNSNPVEAAHENGEDKGFNACHGRWPGP